MNWICLYCGQEFGEHMDSCTRHGLFECPKRRQLPTLHLADVQKMIEAAILSRHAWLARN